MRVANLTTSAITLYRGTNIAKFCTLVSQTVVTGKQDLRRTDLVYHNIPTGDAAPVKQASRRLPIHYQPVS